jgi:tetratricopeptide (TPR) repeat protein
MVSTAIERDSSFAEAYALKAIIASEMYWFYFDRSDSIVAAADDLSRRALELAPGLAEGHWARGHYYYRTKLDYDRAMAAVERTLEARPGEADFVALSGDILRRKGDIREALARYRRSVDLAPRDANAVSAVGETLTLLREYDEAEAYSRRAIELQPDYAAAYHQLAQIRIASAGDTAGARRWLMEAKKAGVQSLTDEFGFWDLERLARNPGAAAAAVEALPGGVFANQFTYMPSALALGLALRLVGDSVGARSAFDSARVAIQALVDDDPAEPRYRSALGLAMAGLGLREEAIREGEEGVRLMPPEREAWRGAWRVLELARIYAMTGRDEEAIDRLEYLLSVPSDWSRWTLRLDPDWDPLRENPRFQALVAEE